MFRHYLDVIIAYDAELVDKPCNYDKIVLKVLNCERK